ncbi:uncharacterized protein EV154DRAFT_518572 [Mucor mucedo]|uniref:Uncharacterized protein n=1 Tax=Mucor saturninus TaxID=64648 RepID=A0A8H7V5K1_9FUNG|nr:uncharacterized protein EV154DRAFT_518572 [Mucor mucedo]KAG2202194.1 hypothetical protein INT47_002113 [Mucor saturninus]KAI7888190.1 hypothetical protein EV154DRAFT_518572 [Mucor mucedo]
MSTLKARYSSNTANEVIEVPLDNSKPLTESIINLQNRVNEVLTKVLEEEKQAKKTATAVSTVEQDAKEEELKEMNAEEEDTDSPMAVDRPEVEDKQSVKKQKTDV